MKQFSDMFDDNLVNNQVPIHVIDKSLKNKNNQKNEKFEDKMLIEHKRERQSNNDK